MKYSEKMDLIAKALIAVQKEIAPVVKDSTNPHFKNRYASLDAMTEYVRPILAAEGLTLIQGAEAKDATGDHFFVDVVTTLLHESGQYVESTIRMPLDKANPQGAGSAMTYGRRYGLAALLAITTEEDDDAQAASRNMRATAQAQSQLRSVAEQTGHEPKFQQGPACPVCGSDMWDNRLTKKNPKQPDFKCKDRSCNGVIWPSRDGGKQQQARSLETGAEGRPIESYAEEPDLPF